jgi:hypothetical protein
MCLQMQGLPDLTLMEDKDFFVGEFTLVGKAFAPFSGEVWIRETSLLKRGPVLKFFVLYVSKQDVTPLFLNLELHVGK